MKKESIHGIRAVIFDFFGLFVPELADAWFKKVFSDEVEALRMKNKYCEPLDRGLISQDDFFTEVAALAHTTGPLARDEWLRDRPLNHELVFLAKELKKKYKTLVLSNAEGEFFRNFTSRYDLLPLFDEVIVSGEVGIINPEPQIFELALSRLCVGAEETVFFDDNAQNVAAATALGINSFVYSDVLRMRRDLESLGVSTNY